MPPPASRDRTVTAILGPTNTGKTHRAVERMLEHASGIIGLPLRLLAREVYDRVTARVGEAAVALVTGEEKRVPARPRYWVCTVEAMPTADHPRTPGARRCCWAPTRCARCCSGWCRRRGSRGRRGSRR